MASRPPAGARDRRPWARRLGLALLCLAAWLGGAWPAAPAGGSAAWAAPPSQDKRLVLVAGPDLPEGVRLTPQEVRLLFLGATVIKAGRRLKPLLNTSDPFLEEVFLQKVLFMSKAHYQRRLVALTFRLGRPRPPAFADELRLAGVLRARPEAVSYMWASHARRLGLRVVEELWSGSAP